MIALLLTTINANAGQAYALDTAPGRQHRWLTESEVMLPGHVWLYADQNVDVRARSLRTQLVLDCRARAEARLLHCRVEQASLAGQTYPSERGLLAPVLDEMDAKLTGAEVAIELRRDGRIRTLEVDSQRIRGSSNRRTRYMREVLRSLVMRNLFPLDIQIPHSGLEAGGWPQYDAAALDLLTLEGTAGAGRLVHHAEPWGEHRVMVATAGRATLADGATMDLKPVMFSTDLTGHTVLDTKAGTIVEARWEVHGQATASAGPNGWYHASRVQLRALTPDETLELSPTEEWAPMGVFTGPVEPAVPDPPG